MLKLKFDSSEGEGESQEYDIAEPGPSYSALSRPPTSKMVIAALKNLNEKGGSSVQAIKKYITANYNADVVKLAPYIKKYIKKSVLNGEIKQTKGKGATGSFKLAAKKKSKLKSSPKENDDSKQTGSSEKVKAVAKKKNLKPNTEKDLEGKTLDKKKNSSEKPKKIASKTKSSASKEKSVKETGKSKKESTKSKTSDLNSNEEPKIEHTKAKKIATSKKPSKSKIVPVISATVLVGGMKNLGNRKSLGKSAKKKALKTSEKKETKVKSKKSAKN